MHILKNLSTHYKIGGKNFSTTLMKESPKGFVEGINRAIRGIINRAFGYRCFEHFRYQVIIECGET